MSAHTERRKKHRNRPRSLVYVELEAGNGGMMRDLSEEGFALRAMMPLGVGGKTQFSFSLDEAARISGEGRIVWVKEGGRVAGVEFCGIPHDAHAQISEWLGRGDQATAREPRAPAIGEAEASTLDELRQEARSSLLRVAHPSEDGKTATPDEATSAPAAAPESARHEEPREEQISTRSSAEPPPVETTKCAPFPEAEITPMLIPEAPGQEEPREEPQYVLPRIMLPSLESAEAGAAPEPDIAPLGVPQPEELVELAGAPRESATLPCGEMETDLRDLSPEGPAAAALEPLSAEAAIDRLPGLEPDAEFSEMGDRHPASHLLLRLAIAMMILALITSAVVYHRQVGHALIWLGQVIADPEEAFRSQSPVSRGPAQAEAAAGTTAPSSSPGVSDDLAGSSEAEGRAAPPSTQPAAASKNREVPPILPAEHSSSAKLPSAAGLQPTSQAHLFPAPGSSTGTATVGGQQEYEQAEEILSNGGNAAEPAVAVHLLWAAVEKGNADAEVALAELYRQGKGVARNCAQARILLTVAARKGSTEAQKHLEELRRGGCK